MTTDETYYVLDDRGGPRRIVEAFDETAVAGPLTGLSPQQLRVLEQVAVGMTNKRIAQILGITPRTVQFHLNQAFRKLHVKGRLRAALAFLEFQRAQELPASNDFRGVYPAP